MATTKEYIAFVCEQIERYDDVRYRKMFGEYMAYLNEKPILLICDNTVFVRELTEVEPVMKAFNAECGSPLRGREGAFRPRHRKTRSLGQADSACRAP